jgi:hypothetical protein
LQYLLSPSSLNCPIYIAIQARMPEAGDDRKVKRVDN